MKYVEFVLHRMIDDVPDQLLAIAPRERWSIVSTRCYSIAMTTVEMTDVELEVLMEGMKKFPHSSIVDFMYDPV